MLHEDEPEDEISNTIVQEEITTPANIETSVPATKEATAPITKPQETETATPIEQKTKSQEFTQFGRKSRVSSSSREELIRKALLKTGGM